MNLQVIKNRIRKVLAYTITVFIFLFISAFLILQIPPVQNYFIGKFLKDFTKITGFQTTVESFRMLWFDRLELQNVSVYDPANNQMIKAREILINFELSQLWENKNVNIDGVFVDSAHVFVTRIDESDTSRDLNMNVFIYRINQGYSSGSGGKRGKPPRINIGEAFVNRSQFTYINQDRDSVQTGFDYNHFSLSVDEGQLSSFVILGDTTEFNVSTLIAQDLATKFKVKQISTFFRVCQKSMEFTGLNVQAGESLVSDTVVFTYDKLLDLNDFVNKVKIHARLDNTLIYPQDLAVFINGVEAIEQPFRVKGIFNGGVNNFKFSDMRVDIGKTHLLGSMDMDGLPNITETFMNINLRNSTVDPNDLSFLFNEATMARLTPMGMLTMDGQFLGYTTDFVANGKFIGKLGVINSDINFKVNEKNFDRSEYSGRLSLTKFDLGRYLNDTVTFQKVSMDGRVRGSGLTQLTADFQLNGKVSLLGVKGYDYTNINTNARLALERINGFVEIDDPNLQFSGNGFVDLREGKNIIKVQASLDTAYLHNLKLTRDRVFLHTDLNADIKGLSLDSLIGTADFKNFRIDYNDESLTLESISLNSQHRLNSRRFLLETSLADLEVTGDYYFSDLYTDLQMLSTEISLNLENDYRKTAYYYENKTYKPKSYQAQVLIKVKDIKPLVPLLGVNVSLSPDITIEGNFTSGNTTILQAFTSFDSLQFENTLFVDNEFELMASKISDSTSVLAMASLNSKNQSIGPHLRTSNLLAEGIWNKSHIDFGLDADQVNQTNNVRLKGMVDFMSDSTTITMAPSTLKLLEREWSFRKGNYVKVKNSGWRFNELALVNGEQSISVDGIVSENPSHLLSLDVHALDLSLLNVLTDKQFTGIVDANVKMRNYYGHPTLENDIDIQGLTINEFLIGDIRGRNAWDTAQNKFNINLFVDRTNERIVDLSGDYMPSRTESPLDVTANLKNANLKIVEPFISDILSQIEGTVSGDFKITGHLRSPQINGEGNTVDAQIMVNYLRTMYRFSGKIGLTPSSIYFKDIDMSDAFRNKGKLNGTITHHNFGSMAITLNATFRNFQVLNTTMKDNRLFYGQAYATGDVNFAGPLSNLRITSNARTEKNTRVYIPIGGLSSVDRKAFITFVNFTDTTFIKEIEQKVNKKINLTGITFDLNLDVTPDAYCEIIFDVKSGDIIRGRGNGDLKLQIDTKGEFNMFGPVEFTEGWYNFTLYDIINKEFEIQKGSRITWFGDPYEAVMEINASYNQLASMLPLVDNAAIVENPPPAARRKYPVQVLMKMEGQMLSPTINFEIIAKDLPQNIITDDGTPLNLDLIFTAFKNRLDEQELKRQVFSLIILRRFSSPESFNTSGTVVSSLSELLSNQLSYWMSQVDENLEIDVDVASMDQESFNTFQLRFSYTFMNGRLRVTGDGTFNNTSQNSSSQPNPATVAGDWTVEYKLTADGKLRVKMYSRTNVNPILNSINNQTAITTGASIIYTQTFDELRDLFRSSRDRKSNEPPPIDLNAEALKEDDGGE
jgi:hypothetical protein